MRIGGEAPGWRTHSFSRHKGHRGPRVTPPRMETGGLLSGQAECLEVYENRHPGGWVHAAGRRTTPSGTMPVVVNRHKAISNLRASATIIGLRVPLTVSVRA
jgi:hypothetical protein